MPKSPKPPPVTTDANLVRKKKNADAQAAFRARRQNYISTLEETVTSLESVVIQLQESCRETRNENLELRQENSRLRYENREREKHCRAVVQSRKSAHAVSSPFPAPSSTLLHPDSFTSSLSYRTSDPSVTQTYASSSFVDHHTPVATFTNHNDVDDPDRSGKYDSYPYSIPEPPPDPRWQLTTSLPTCLSSTGVATHQSRTSYLEPLSTGPVDLALRRFPTNEAKVTLGVLGAAPYVFPAGSRFPDSTPHSRSMSPTTSASSATPLPLTSSLQLSLQSTEQSPPDFEHRSQSLSHCPEVTLHGGIPDISPAAGHPASIRHRFARRSDSNQDHLPMQQHDGFSQHEDSTTRLRGNRRSLVVHPYRRSQSPGPTPLSSTVAIIKAQAFGALRRTRAKTKKTTDSAARVAQDVLEARGIGPTPVPMATDNEG